MQRGGASYQQPLSAVKTSTTLTSDQLGAIVHDPVGNRVFMLCEVKGTRNVNRGNAVVLFTHDQLSAADGIAKVVNSISEASATSGYAMVGIAVNQSAAASGHRIWVLVQGMLGNLGGSKYNGMLYALASTDTAKGNGLRAVSAGASGLKLENGEGDSNRCGFAMAADSGGILTTGFIFSPIIKMA